MGTLKNNEKTWKGTNCRSVLKSKIPEVRDRYTFKYRYSLEELLDIEM